jgi:hypothetical protein
MDVIGVFVEDIIVLTAAHACINIAAYDGDSVGAYVFITDHGKSMQVVDWNLDEDERLTTTTTTLTHSVRESTVREYTCVDAASSKAVLLFLLPAIAVQYGLNNISVDVMACHATSAFFVTAAGKVKAELVNIGLGRGCLPGQLDGK